MQTFQRISNLHQHEKRRDPVQSLMENPTEPFLIYRVGSALFCAPLAQIFEVRAEADLQKIEINSNLKFIRIRDVLFSWIDLHEKFTESRGDGPSIVLLIQQSRHQLAVAVSAMIGLAELSPSSAIAHRRYREEIHPDLICSVHDTPYGLTAQIDFGKLAVDEAPSLKVILQKMYDPNPS